MRRNFRTIAAACLLGPLTLAAASCDRHVEPFVEGEEPSAPDLSRIFPPEDGGASAAEGLPDAMGGRGAAPVVAGGGAPTSTPSNSPDALRGVIELAPGSSPPDGAVLFIIARRAEAGGPPLAVIREGAPRFPFAFGIGPEHVMMPGTTFAGELVVSARLDRDGSATTREAADLEGAIAGAVPVGSEGLEIVLGGGAAAPRPTPMPTPAGRRASSTGTTIRGTIELAAGPADGSSPASSVLFLIARSAAGRGGPPVAVLRVPQPSFPFEYEIGPAQVMIPTMRFEGELVLSARLDGDGDAITRSAGDVQNASRIVAEPGDTGVAIVLDERL